MLSKGKVVMAAAYEFHDADLLTAVEQLMNSLGYPHL